MSKEAKELAAADETCGNACSCGAATSDSGIMVDGVMRRRDFVAYGAAALALAALAACGVSGDALTSPSTLNSTSLNLSDFPALATVGGVATTSVSSTPIAIVRTASSSFVAFSRICPHQGNTINVTSTGFYCPGHGATFNKSGVWVGGQRTNNLTSYPVQYDATTGALTIG
jgi:nitrite reductase/ring-hydroxylating ferredoxin subunit